MFDKNYAVCWNCAAKGTSFFIEICEWFFRSSYKWCYNQ